MMHFNHRRVDFVPTRAEYEDDTPADPSRSFAPLHETPVERQRFLIRFTFCVALAGFGVVTALHGWGVL